MKLLLYVADEFKTLEGGKTLAVGLFTDRVVVLNVPRNVPPPSAELPYGISLGLVACLLELPAAELNASGSITTPTGPSAMSLHEIKVKGVVGGSANLQMRFDPFLVSAPGTYTLTLSFAGFPPLSESFEFRIEPVDEPQSVAFTMSPFKPAPAQGS